MLVVVRLVFRLGSRGIGDSGSKKDLLGLIENKGEDGGGLGWEGKLVELRIITDEGVRVDGRLGFSEGVR